ncbi:MAG: nucleoside triphosphate pyrophosphohydrolase [Gammaproteobacteria bacterium]|nr:MAG: nucleoside triphosphate pyrophosphohydrolase [Gammaproteobacteria bacterium]
MKIKTTDLTSLTDIMARLRDPVDGCPWDLQQSHATLVPMTFEEVAELADAVAAGDSANLCEELGDVLFHLVFYAQLAEEAGDFDMQTVIDQVAEKMVRRHPHIFAGKVYANEAEQAADWQRIKAEEKALYPDTYPHLTPLLKTDNLPAMAQSVAMQKQLQKLGFDWQHADEVVPKIHEEIDELKAEMQTGDTEAMADEFGDLLFAVLNLGRKLKIDPEMALRKANHKFYSRSEQMIAEMGGTAAFADLSLDEKEALWQAVKEKVSE